MIKRLFYHDRDKCKMDLDISTILNSNLTTEYFDLGIPIDQCNADKGDYIIEKENGEKYTFPSTTVWKMFEVYEWVNLLNNDSRMFYPGDMVELLYGDGGHRHERIECKILGCTMSGKVLADFVYIDCSKQFESNIIKIDTNEIFKFKLLSDTGKIKTTDSYINYMDDLYN